MDSVSSHSTKQSGKTGASSFEASPLPNVRANFGRLKLAEFVVKETLGTGTFGRVRLAMHKQTGRHFALKIAKKREVIRLKQIDHVRSEKDLLSRLDHPFIVKLYGTSTSSNYLYMLMEYVVGGEIFSHLRAAGRFPEATARFYAAEIILAVEYLHSMDVVYRDLKPENLLLDKDGHLKITDFGFAKVRCCVIVCFICPANKLLVLLLLLLL
jgi:serine/threonine protein kinase